MADCNTCVNVVFDETWGEYKCKVKHHRIYKPEEQTDCKDYKKNYSKNA